MNTKTLVGILVGLIFIVGAGVIIYNGRPVMKLENSLTSTPTSTTSAPAATSTPTASAATTTATEPTPAPSQPKPKPTSTASAPTPAPTPTPAPAPQPGTYTLADVQAHATPASCWTTISGNVYDLTTWVERHPGGENPIKGLCGIDGTARFERKHGESRAPIAALGLLKIGTLR